MFGFIQGGVEEKRTRRGPQLEECSRGGRLLLLSCAAAAVGENAISVPGTSAAMEEPRAPAANRPEARQPTAVEVVSGRRYLLLTVAATAIAAAATYQRVLEMTPAQRRLLLAPAVASDAADPTDFRVDGRPESLMLDDERTAPVMFALRVFFAELVNSRLSAMVSLGWWDVVAVVSHVMTLIGARVIHLDVDGGALPACGDVPRLPCDRPHLLWPYPRSRAAGNPLQLQLDYADDNLID